MAPAENCFNLVALILPENEPVICVVPTTPTFHVPDPDHAATISLLMAMYDWMLMLSAEPMRMVGFAPAPMVIVPLFMLRSSTVLIAPVQLKSPSRATLLAFSIDSAASVLMLLICTGLLPVLQIVSTLVALVLVVEMLTVLARPVTVTMPPVLSEVLSPDPRNVTVAVPLPVMAMWPRVLLVSRNCTCSTPPAPTVTV